ncbi:MAG: hypothetical protein ACXAC7_15200 [Candidatus Hodarchaeales archaeon]
MSPLNHELRKRVRRLPEPPSSEFNGMSPIPPVINDIPASKTSSSFNQKKTAPPIAKNLDVNLPGPSTTVSASGRPPVPARHDRTIMSELSDIFEEGIDKTLVKANDKLLEKKSLYPELKLQQFKRAVFDYEQAGIKLQESGLYSNASISFGCAVLAELLSEQSVNAAFEEFEKIRYMANPSIIGSSFFVLLNALFDAIIEKNTLKFQRQVEKLKNIETFSSDDQDLLASAVAFLLGFTRNIM